MEEYMDTTKKIIMIIIVSIVLIRTNQKIFKWILKKQNKIHINFLSGIITACIIFIAISMIGMQLDATNIWIEPKNKRDKKVKKVKDIVKFAIGFTIDPSCNSSTLQNGGRTLGVGQRAAYNEIIDHWHYAPLWSIVCRAAARWDRKAAGHFSPAVHRRISCTPKEPRRGPPFPGPYP